MTESELEAYKKANPGGKKKNCDDGFQEAGLTYIKQIKYEKRLKRPLQTEVSARPTSWGTFLEQRAFTNIDDLEFQLVSKIRYSHQTIDNWSGMPDLIKPLHVGDIKCPYSLESFCDKIAALQDLETFKKEFPADYWQNISNACLLESNGIEIKFMVWAIYVPYLSELEEIHDEVQNFDGDQNPIAWINYSGESGLTHILDDGHYKNINIFTFDIPREDMEYLTERVKLANTMLDD